MSIFETASRKQFRFPSAAGQLTTEQLWDLPLIAGLKATRDVKVDLDTVARTVNAELKSITEDSFVESKPDPRRPDLEAKLEILKHIIGIKQAEAKAAEDARDRAEKRRKLVEALGTRENEALSKMSKEDILAELTKLDAAS